MFHVNKITIASYHQKMLIPPLSGELSVFSTDVHFILLNHCAESLFEQKKNHVAMIQHPFFYTHRSMLFGLTKGEKMNMWAIYWMSSVAKVLNYSPAVAYWDFSYFVSLSCMWIFQEDCQLVN